MLLDTTALKALSFFRFEERGTHFWREVSAGVTTFMVMAYIIFVNPAILSYAGMPHLSPLGPPQGQVLVATCLASGLMTLMMGLVSNRPFALAPGMGLNAMVAFELVLGAGLTWQEAMGVVVLSGSILTLLIFSGLGEAVVAAIPLSLKYAIGIGIGFFIFFIGLVNGGLVRVPVETVPYVGGEAMGQPATPLVVGALDNLPVLVTIIGLVITILLFTRGWQFGLLVSVVLTTVIAILLNATTGFTAFTTGATIPEALFALPDFSFLRLPGLTNIPGIFAKLGFPIALMTIFSLMLTDFFDSSGTIIGLSEQLGEVGPDGQVEQLRPILLVDSLAAAVGGALGASLVTTCVESAAGVAAGGRTGLSAIVTAFLFFLAMFFAPLASIIPPQATAPVLIVVGFLMTSALKKINWNDFGEAFPALMTILVMPLAFSLIQGIAFGFISYVLIKLFQGRGNEVHWLMSGASAAFLLFLTLPGLQAIFGF
jgi:AGZA family xanthine/uracil permease-like MFS transporter